MGKKEENTGFICKNCCQVVLPLQNGGYRNHCPFCLSSLHVDESFPGDRKSSCLGLMEAVGVRCCKNKGWQIIHRCKTCGVERVNKIAERDVQSDNWAKIVGLSLP